MIVGFNEVYIFFVRRRAKHFRSVQPRGKLPREAVLAIPPQDQVGGSCREAHEVHASDEEENALS